MSAWPTSLIETTHPARLADPNGAALVVDRLVVLAGVERNGVVGGVLVGAGVGAAVAGARDLGGAVEDYLAEGREKAGWGCCCRWCCCRCVVVVGGVGGGGAAGDAAVRSGCSLCHEHAMQ